MTAARVGIVGAGTMGSGIAQLAALAGYETVIYDPDPEAMEGGALRIGDDLARGDSRGLWSVGESEAALECLNYVSDLADLAGCDLVVEAAPESIQLKREIFTELAAALGPEPVLATNTSSLRVAEVAAGVPHPERVVGMHFFNPPALMKLVEVVAAERSSEAALATTIEIAERMGRTPIRAKDSPGFVANRLARPFTLESLRMLADGVGDIATIDRIVRLGGGFRMGPFELIDLIGLDVNLEIARSFFRQGGEPERWRPNPIQERLVAEGKLGRKSGHGYYDYAEERYSRRKWAVCAMSGLPSGQMSSGDTLRSVSCPIPEVAYSITSSAREMSVAGIVKPSVRAVCKLIASSNRVGCSTGSSRGLDPLMILATYVADRRYISGKLGPYESRPPSRT